MHEASDGQLDLNTDHLLEIINSTSNGHQSVPLHVIGYTKTMKKLCKVQDLRLTEQ